MANVVEIKNKQSLISIDKDFNYETHKSFINSIKESLEAGVKDIILDFTDVEYMDSSALGLLMVAKKEATTMNCHIKIKQVSGYSRKVLEMSNFDKKFELID